MPRADRRVIDHQIVAVLSAEGEDRLVALKRGLQRIANPERPGKTAGVGLFQKPDQHSEREVKGTQEKRLGRGDRRFVDSKVG